MNDEMISRYGNKKIADDLALKHKPNKQIPNRTRRETYSSRVISGKRQYVKVYEQDKQMIAGKIKELGLSLSEAYRVGVRLFLAQMKKI